MKPAAPAVQAGPHKGWTIALASLGLFMAALDGLVVTTSLPALRLSLNASLADLEWIVNAFTLALACLILFGASLGDRFGRRRMYAVGLAIFTAFSALAALSPNVGVLIVARVGQGIGAAMVMPLSLTLISDAFPAEKRGAAIGLWGGVGGAAVAFGPVIGGAVVQGLTWEWIFWLNVPVGLVLIPLSLRKLTESYGPAKHLDVGGLILSVLALFGLTWGLVKVSDSGWGSAAVIVPLVLGAVFVVVFVIYEARRKIPMVKVSLFRGRGFTTGVLVNFFMFAALFGAEFLMAQFLITGLGNSPLQAGLKLLPWMATAMFVAPIAGAMSEKFGNRPFMAVGLLLSSGGMFWIAAIAAPGMGYLVMGIALLLSGVGISLVFPTVANAVVSSVAPQDIGVASGTSTMMQQVGGAFGVALIASVFAAGNEYSSPQAFVDSFSTAILVPAILSALGAAVALASPGIAAIRAAAARRAASMPAPPASVIGTAEEEQAA
ncbi:MFS transporter [Actinocrispum wychmicini]|uniref:EmrB/QacA subfamily drug resistance transporter n=1 Tax=Actinocrispum wychmicini TaxID=1213861 RepID=A0A4R2IPX8_9PSEU|nr:MFS transporter [Actinocrispum wychmicini]TCO47421.1 EmrB/QacA subfamily drug resistance transporter [Actinocrispum wychmicini]